MWILAAVQFLSVIALAIAENAVSPATTVTAIKPNALEEQPKVIPEDDPGSNYALRLAGQMTQVQLSTFVDHETAIINQAMATQFAKMNIGSIFNSVNIGKMNLNVTQWRQLVKDLKSIWKREGADPLVFALDSVHGANYVTDSVKFAHQIGLAASFNLTLGYLAGQIAAKETIAAGVNILFGPILDLGTNKRMSRVQETAGECPFVVSLFGEALIRGIQSTKITAATAKHFLAYMAVSFDRSDVQIAPFNLKNYYLRPYRYAMKAGVKVVMTGYHSINRVPVVSSKLYNDVILRGELKFNGTINTDYRELYNQNTWHGISPDEQTSAEMALQTSLDIIMEVNSSNFPSQVLTALKKGSTTLKHLETANNRIKALKTSLGVIDNDNVPGEEYVAEFRSAEHVQVAVDIARESMVLLKNNNSILPLDPNVNVFLTGAASEDIGIQCGAWTIGWQGVKEDNSLFKNGISFKKGLSAIGKNVKTFAGIRVDTTGYTNLAKSMEMAKNSDVIIVTIAELPGTEKLADIYDSSFEKNQLDYVRELKKAGKRIILVLVCNRPRLLNGLVEEVDAIINTFLPGEMGGQALGEIIYGKLNPSGKLPYTYPKFESLMDYVYYAPVDLKCVGYAKCVSEFPFGFGLSYTIFNHTNIQLSKTTITRHEILHVSVTVTNTGRVAGKEVVFLYVVQPVRKGATPEMKMVKGVTKVNLQPGEVTVVNFVLDEDSWTYYSADEMDDFTVRFEESDFFVTTSDVDCRDGPHPKCVQFSVTN